MPRPRTPAVPFKLTFLLGAGLLIAGALGLATVAAAQASVTVEVRATSGDAAEARVTLTPAGGGAAHSCQTRAGRCAIAGVPAGRYVVSATPSGGGQSPIPRPVMVGGRTTTVRVTLR